MSPSSRLCRAAYSRPSGLGSPQATFVSSHWLPLGYYLWQRGEPWAQEGQPWQEGAPLPGPPIGLFQIERRWAPSLGGPPTPEAHRALLWKLEQECREVTASIEAQSGRPLSTRVFVRDAP